MKLSSISELDNTHAELLKLAEPRKKQRKKLRKPKKLMPAQKPMKLNVKLMNPTNTML